MPTKIKPRPAKRATKSSSKTTALVPVPATAPEAAFVTGVLTRGEAAKPSRSGKLAKSATHAIVDDKDGTPTLKRHKFNAY